MSIVRSALIALAATLAVMCAALTPLAAAGEHHAREHQGGYAGHAGHGHHARRSEERRQRSEARRSRSEARRREARSEVRLAEEARDARGRRTRTEARTETRHHRRAGGAHHHRPRTGTGEKSQHEKSQEEKSQKPQEKSEQKPGAQQSGAEHDRDVGSWSVREWLKATEDWARKNREKWDDCQKQSKDQGLTGLKSRTFLATCMTSST